MRSATRRGLTTAIALLTALIAGLWVAAPAQAHEGVNVTLHTDGAGAVWGVVTYVDGHAVTGPITGILLAVSPDGTEPGRAGGGEGRRGSDRTAWCATTGSSRPASGGSPSTWPRPASPPAPWTSQSSPTAHPRPKQQVCAASFWPTPAADDSNAGGGTSLVVAVAAVGAVVAAAALWIALRARRDRPGGGSGGGRPSGPSGGPRRERTGTGGGRSKTR